VIGEYLRLAFASGLVLAPGWLLARACRLRSPKLLTRSRSHLDSRDPPASRVGRRVSDKVGVSRDRSAHFGHPHISLTGTGGHCGLGRQMHYIIRLHRSLKIFVPQIDRITSV